MSVFPSHFLSLSLSRSQIQSNGSFERLSILQFITASSINLNKSSPLGSQVLVVFFSICYQFRHRPPFTHSNRARDDIAFKARAIAKITTHPRLSHGDTKSRLFAFFHFIYHVFFCNPEVLLSSSFKKLLLAVCEASGQDDDEIRSRNRVLINR